MIEVDGEGERSRDVDRLLTFVDAIVAIAITLLVLPLAELATGIGEHDSVWRVVREHSGEFGGFLLSFVVIARLWLAQHRTVRGALEATQEFSTLLIAWALTIAFLPFPTALLSAHGHEATTKVFYLGTLALSSALLSLLAVSVRRQRPAPHDALRPRITPAMTNALLSIVALVVSLLVPVLSYYPLLLQVFADPIERLLKRRTARTNQPGSA